MRLTREYDDYCSDVIVKLPEGATLKDFVFMIQNYWERNGFQPYCGNNPPRYTQDFAKNVFEVVVWADKPMPIA